MSTSNKIIVVIGIVVVLLLSYFLIQNNKVIVVDDRQATDDTSLMSNATAATNTLLAVIKSTSTQNKMNKARIKTNKGDIVIEFNSTAPKTVENFQTLSSKGFYDGVRFHRVIKGFMIQTGDPLSKDKANIEAWGTGGPDNKFADELSGNETYKLGTVAMANSGPNTNGSQFFIVSTADSQLPPRYTVFAKVVSGLETVEAIQNVKTTGQPMDRPLDDVIVEKVTLE